MNQIIYAGRHALTMTVSRHTHTSWELIYCTTGKGAMHFDDRELAYEANDVTIIPPLLPHSNHSVEGFTNFHINLEDATFTYSEPQVFRGDRNGFLLDAFRAVFYYYSTGTPDNALLPAYGQLIASYLAVLQPEHPYSEIIQKIENHILSNFPNCTFELNSYLQTLPFSSAYLIKLFKKETGLTPHQFLTEKRLESARHNLATICDHRNISEVAHLSGFSNPLYFSRLFKKTYGVSPSNYTPEKPEPPITDSDAMKIML